MTMQANPPITHWLSFLKAGDHAAAQPLWNVYFDRLVQLVQQRLPGYPSIDKEGVAASAFNSFWLAAARGRFPRLDDRQDLWRLLVTIAGQKIADHVERANTLKGGYGKKRVDGAILDVVIGSEPTPEMAAMVSEEFQRLLDCLPNDEYRSIALWKMEGYTNEEISERLGCAVRTVGNRLDVIRMTLKGRAPS